MDDDIDTVELPAHPEIKQLSHDVVRENNRHAVPIILDLYDLLSDLEKGEEVRANEVSVDEPRSDLDTHQWGQFIDLLLQAEILERGSASTSYLKLSSE